MDVRAYLKARTSQFHATRSTPSLSITDVVETLVFHTLPSVAAKLLRSSSHEPQSTTDRIFFFNEHYVVKPPRSTVTFRWHQDGAEQLAMCVHRAEIPPYVSAWCALDDVTTANGPLRFVSRRNAAADRDNNEADDSDSGDRDTDRLDAVASDPIIVAAGTVVFFRSDVWHCSSNNGSDAVRRAFYAQYSAVRITASPADPWPLSFAIPCVVSHKGEEHWTPPPPPDSDNVVAGT